MKILSEDPFENRLLELFDFISWVESKIENRSFGDIIRKKAQPYLGSPHQLGIQIFNLNKVYITNFSKIVRQ